MTVKSHKQNEAIAIPASIQDNSIIEPAFDRKKLLELTGSLIQETYDRVSGERFRVREGDRERLAYLRTLKELISLYNTILEGANIHRYEGLPVGMTEEDRDIEKASLKSARRIEKLLSMT